MSQPTIEEIAERAASGDADAFDELIHTQLDRLSTHVKSRLGPRLRESIESDDVVQETILKACSAVQNFVWTGEGPFFRWLARIAEHVIWTVSQKQRVKLALAPVRDGRVTPSTRAARQERRERLDRALGDLTDEHRVVITLTRLEGLPIAEVATRMGRSPNAVKKLLARALAKLRSRYGESTGSLRVVESSESRTLEGGTVDVSGS